MKSRSGFVSNSSSCSFVLVLPKTEEKEFMNSLDDIQKALMKDFREDKTKTFLGEECVIFSQEVGYLWECPEYVLDNLSDKFTKEEVDELEDGYSYNDNEAIRKFKEIYGYSPNSSDAFDAIKFPKNSLVHFERS